MKRRLAAVAIFSIVMAGCTQAPGVAYNIGHKSSPSTAQAANPSVVEDFTLQSKCTMLSAFAPQYSTDSFNPNTNKNLPMAQDLYEHAPGFDGRDVNFWGQVIGDFEVKTWPYWKFLLAPFGGDDCLKNGTVVGLELSGFDNSWGAVDVLFYLPGTPQTKSELTPVIRPLTHQEIESSAAYPKIAHVLFGQYQAGDTIPVWINGVAEVIPGIGAGQEYPLVVVLAYQAKVPSYLETSMKTQAAQ